MLCDGEVPTRTITGTSKDGIPLLAKPKYASKCEPTPDGSKWEIDPGMGIKMYHEWTVKEGGLGGSVKECTATEKTILEAPMLVFHGVKLAYPGTQEKSHKALVEYFKSQE